MAQNIYRYQPLDSANGQFRILRLFPAKKSSDLIQCELICERLDRKPEYEALSYTWGGNSKEGLSIVLGGRKADVRENLEAALRRLRKETKPRDIWIDAVCINQDDEQEKSEQVLQMKQIYEQAQQVVVWLGEIGIGDTIGLKAIAHAGGGFKGYLKVWQMEKKFGIRTGWKQKMALASTGEISGKEFELGEVAQLLDRPWWRRVWIVQEVVLAKKAVIMCGPDEVPWDSIKYRMRDGVYGILGQERGQFLRHLDGRGTVLDKYPFPNSEHLILDSLQGKRRSGCWDESLYKLMYTFRRFDCTNPRDRVYAFLGLAADINNINIIPNYSSDVDTSKIYIDVARALILSDKSLIVFNCKREYAPKQNVMQQSQIYSVPEQAQFLDPNAQVADKMGKPPRPGWIRLADGWERQKIGDEYQFFNHHTQTAQKHSPLVDQFPMVPQRSSEHRGLPRGWTKEWDNRGVVRYTYDVNHAATNPPETRNGVAGLPSWVPDWSSWSVRDPTPLHSLGKDTPRYWASGIKRDVHFSASEFESDTSTLRLTGMLFDKIKTISRAWCPEPHELPISRYDVSILKEWQVLACTTIPDCPYAGSGGRYDAYWRTHVADYAGERRATTEDGNYFETWTNQGGWMVKADNVMLMTDKTTWEKSMSRVTEGVAMGEMYPYMVKSGFVTAPSLGKIFKTMEDCISRYKDMRKRIYDASINRAMFVTSKGYIGLAPWNAMEGDLVTVLFGGSTPFLLRKAPSVGRDQYTFVGESYVYGIMGGELFNGKMGHARLRSFEIV